MIDLIHNFLHEMLDPLERMLASLGLGFPELSTILIIFVICIGIPWINVFRKAGYSPLKGWLMLIPLVNVFVFFSFAFGEWPIERDLRKLDPSSMWKGY